MEIKGRGNYTWNNSFMLKKPYQIKFDSKTSVLGMPKAKKWVLLANYSDASLLRNKLAFDIAERIGLAYPESEFVDLYVNDEYIGNYLLCEKNEIGKGRIELSDDYGVLCEIDGNYGTGEDYYFKTKIEKTVVVLSESVADDLGEENSKSKAAFALFEEKLNAFEALLHSDSASWDEIAALIDVDSFINYYFLQELSEDPDGCRSSFYLYSDGADDVIHLGPVWDYDSAFGQYKSESLGGNTKVDYTLNIKSYMGSTSVSWFNKLFGFSDFEDLAIEAYKERIKPVFDEIPEMIGSYISDEAFAKSAEMNFERWTELLGNKSVFSGGHRYAASYEEEVQYLLNWLDERVEYMNERYDNKPDVPDVPDEPEQPYFFTRILSRISAIREQIFNSFINLFNKLFSFIPV